MKRLANTLYVTTQGSYLAKEGDTVAVRLEGQVRLRVPIHNLEGIVCFGQVGASPALMGLCGQRGVTLSFLTERGRFLARVQGPVSGNVLLRRQQYRIADDREQRVVLARSFVIGKLVNCRSVLLRGARDRPASQGTTGLREAASRLAAIGQRLEREGDLEAVRGLEGEAARAYFGVFDHLITADGEHFFFKQRSRRPPLDNMNALLSFLYVLVAHDVTSALEGVGLDPAVGFLHADRPGRPSLALDMMEEMRPLLADRVALSLVNRRQVRASGFNSTESGAVAMDDGTRKTVLQAYQKRKQEVLTHSFLEDKFALGLLPHAQALLLARRLRGDLDGYPPFFWK
ncbi:MAG: type I-C CRISPR-associated endonuclease Cas1c [Desulfarculaceae bacterium]|nr:type I-C CRISPR-associated endonuclease Cas1c [Desulfarculaceae bacterium]